MIFNFKLVSDEVDHFKREIQIDAASTFLDLKKAICNSVGYDNNKLSSFVLCDDNWEKEKEITSEDMGTDPDQEIWLMDESVLGDFIEDEGQKLLFVFDYLTERAFFMEMNRMITGKTLMEPVVTLSVGKAPDEYIEEDIFEPKADVKATAADARSDFDEDFYGTEDYNEDELDNQGFDEMPLND